MTTKGTKTRDVARQNNVSEFYRAVMAASKAGEIIPLEK
jgi:hypothetical protein